MAQTSTPASKTVNGDNEGTNGKASAKGQEQPASARGKGRQGPSSKRPSVEAEAPRKGGGEAQAVEKAPKKAKGRGVALRRHSTQSGSDPLDRVTWEKRTSVITNPDGSVVFKMTGAEIPAGWSQLATDIAVSKYFRKAGLHGKKESGETSVRQVVHRLAHTLREAGERFGGYFASKGDADTFEAELSYMLVHQIGAFNSPVWFNVGLFQEYQIEGSGGNFAWDSATNSIFETPNAYERPQGSACFIQRVSDDLMGIYAAIQNEARLFKHGSGVGSNFSAIRGRQEKLSGGGTSSVDRSVSSRPNMRDLRFQKGLLR